MNGGFSDTLLVRCGWNPTGLVGIELSYEIRPSGNQTSPQHKIRVPASLSYKLVEIGDVDLATKQVGFGFRSHNCSHRERDTTRFLRDSSLMDIHAHEGVCSRNRSLWLR